MSRAARYIYGRIIRDKGCEDEMSKGGGWQSRKEEEKLRSNVQGRSDKGRG
jgi:hypothetical protein